MSYTYLAVADLDDGTSRMLDLEVRGWADKSLLRRVIRWSLIPKEGATTMTGGSCPIVSVVIPPRGRPVFKSRVYGTISATGLPSVSFRCYGIGYKLGPLTHLAWVLPTGDIEMTTGEDSLLAEVLLQRLKATTATSRGAEECIQEGDDHAS